jgi:formate hydrogenlyase subunit 3/multisubunit Na+/H+ antiporter MnhD subunit
MSLVVLAGYLLWAPYLAVALLFLVDRAPGWFKGLVSLAAIAGFGWLAWDGLDALRQFFAVMLLGGGALYAVAALRKGGARPGLHPLMTMVTLSLGAVLVAQSPLGFFFAWETMTLSSWLLVLRGRRAEKPALAYIVFGLGGAFLLMTGLAAGGIPAGGCRYSRDGCSRQFGDRDLALRAGAGRHTGEDRCAGPACVAAGLLCRG